MDDIRQIVSVYAIQKKIILLYERTDTSIAAAAVKAEAHTESSTAINDEVQSSISRKAGPAIIQETILFPCYSNRFPQNSKSDHIVGIKSEGNLGRSIQNHNPANIPNAIKR